MINIAAYKFITLDNLAERKARYQALCEELAIKGTILLAPEGINLFMAGTDEAITRFKAVLCEDAPFQDLVFKESVSETQPFKRLRIKVKKEIITLRDDSIKPEQHTVEHISPEQLKQWLDEGRDFTLLDTRNAFEIDFGTFESATHLYLDCFTQFAKAADDRLDEVKDKPVVMFCTGGIRCEKAGPVLEKQGFKDVYQLDGGILNYFERCGGAHYQGNCFVFDERVALDSNLKAQS